VKTILKVIIIKGCRWPFYKSCSDVSFSRNPFSTHFATLYSSR